MKKRVFATVWNGPHFTELMRLVRVLQATGRYRAELLFLREYESIAAHKAILQAEQIPYHDIFRHAVSDTLPWDPAKGLRERFVEPNADRLERTPVVREVFRNVLRMGRASYAVLRVGQFLLRNHQMRRAVAEVFRRCPPDLVLIAEDNLATDPPTSLLTQLGQQFGAAVVDAHHAQFGVIGFLDVVRYRTRSLRIGLSRGLLVNRLFPSWCLEYRGERFIRIPDFRMLPLQLQKLLTPSPWVHGADENIDLMLVDSQVMYDRWRELGIPAQKMVLTGALAQDDLVRYRQTAATRRRKLCQELGFDDRPLLASAPPHDHIDFRIGLCDFHSYDDVIGFWVEQLSAIEGYNVAIRVHPRYSVDDFKKFETERVRFVDWDTAELIAMCDLFVTSGSSTSRWAVLCGVPVLNYDLYRYHWKDYVDTGFIDVSERQDFIDQLHELTTNPTLRERLRKRQSEVWQQWGFLDGKVGERMCRAIDQLLALSPEERSRRRMRAEAAPWYRRTFVLEGDWGMTMAEWERIRDPGRTRESPLQSLLRKLFSPGSTPPG